MFDWQDLQYFLVLARCGSLSAAALELHVEHATVGRRLASLERALGLKLVHKLPRGAALTEDGETVLALAASMRDAAEHIEAHAQRSAATRAGTVRMSVPPVLGHSVIAPQLGAFRTAHPHMRIVLAATPEMAALDRGVTDVAVRMVRPTQGGLVAQRVGTLRFALYASHDYAARRPASWEFLAYDASLDHVRHQKWLRGMLAGRPIVFEASDTQSLQMAARSGAGVAVLPTNVGERDPALTRLPDPDAPPDTDLWLVTWPDLRRNPTVLTVMTFLASCIREDPLLSADERSHVE
jgi:DNA-binding transcriptional LysR family regulator